MTDARDARQCQIYRRAGTFYVVCQSKTTDGIWIATEPMIQIADGDETALGHAVLKAIDASRTGIPRPSSPRAVTDALLKFVGQRSWSAFARSARLVDARESGDGTIVLTPYTRAEGNAYYSDDARSVSTAPDAAQIGAALGRVR